MELPEVAAQFNAFDSPELIITAATAGWMDFCGLGVGQDVLSIFDRTSAGLQGRPVEPNEIQCGPKGIPRGNAGKI